MPARKLPSREGFGIGSNTMQFTNSLTGTAKPDPQVGIWLRGQLPRRRTIRGDGPLHRVQVQLSGRFHWRPKAGAGHGHLWTAWIGVRAVVVIAQAVESDVAELHA